MKLALFLVVAVVYCTPASVASATRAEVRFRHDGMFLVDGKPFFPLGIWVYNLDSNVMAVLREHQFNTVVGGGFKPDDIPLIEKHGLMMIPHATEFLAKGMIRRFTAGGT